MINNNEYTQQDDVLDNETIAIITAAVIASVSKVRIRRVRKISDLSLAEEQESREF